MGFSLRKAALLGASFALVLGTWPSPALADLSAPDSGGGPAVVTTSPQAVVSVNARVALKGADLEAGRFTFELASKDDPAATLTAANAADGSVTFDLSLDAPGSYAYRLAQVAGDTDGMAYDAAVFDVAVEVPEAPGAPTVSYSDAEGPVAAADFVNEYTAPAPEGSWVEDEGGLRWKEPDGTWGAAGWKDVGGTTYLLDAEGYRLTGWQDVDGSRYYLDPTTGAKASGWVEVDGHRFYLGDDGALRTGWTEVDGKRYWLRTDGTWGPVGSAGKGWLVYQGHEYLIGDDGAMVVGWGEHGGHRFWLRTDGTFGPVGSKGTGLLVTGGKSYWLRTNSQYGPVGSMGTGWLRGYYGQDYYFGADGAMVTGWLNVGGQRFWMRTDDAWGPVGSMGTGWLSQDGHRFWLRTSGNAWGPRGSVGTGWLDWGGQRYFLRTSSEYGPVGSMGTGWLDKGGQRYYLRGDGTLVRNGWIAGTYYAGSSGAILRNAWTPDGYYVNGAGVKDTSVARDDMSLRAQRLSSRTNYLILVNVRSNNVGVFQGRQGAWSKVNASRCSSGAPATPTVRGEFTVGSRGYVFGSGYSCYYWTQFYGNYLFHSVLYNQGTRQIQDGRLGMNISHGCVRLPIDFAYYIYSSIPSGTKVYVYA